MFGNAQRLKILVSRQGAKAQRRAVPSDPRRPGPFDFAQDMLDPGPVPPCGRRAGCLAVSVDQRAGSADCGMD